MVYSVYQHKETGDRIAYPGVGQTSESRAASRRRRRLSAAMETIPFSSFLTLTYRDECLPESSEHIKKTLNRMKAYFRKSGYAIATFSYVWVIEYGELLGRPHFHLLTTILYAQSVLHKKQPEVGLEGWWGRGTVTVKPVHNIRHGVRYITKYMCKVQEKQKVRSYGTSRDIPATPKSMWEWLGLFREDQLALVIETWNE